jgi:hypothetical protein
MKRLLATLPLALLGLAPGVAPEPPKENPNAAADGQALVAQLLAQTPAQNLTNRGVLKIRAGKGPWREVPVRFQIFATDAGWASVYETEGTNHGTTHLTIARKTDGALEYRLAQTTNGACPDSAGQVLAGAATLVPFAGSDFWVADLGLEFLRWPTQRLLRKEMTRGQSCNVLESTAPAGQTNGYVRVLAWLDIDTGGVVYAEAYDAKGKLLKEFAPKAVKKVGGQWELEEMEISNRQTGSRTRIQFNFVSEPATAR